MSSKQRWGSNGCIYVETKVEGKKLQAIVNIGADTVCMKKELADEISLSYKKEKGYAKGINAKSLPIYRVARDTDILVRPWRAKVNVTIGPLYD